MSETTVVTTGDDANGNGNGGGAEFAAGVAAATAAQATEDAQEAEEIAERAEERADDAQRTASDAIGEAFDAQAAVGSLREFVEVGFAELGARIDALGEVTADVVEEVADAPERTDGDQGDSDAGKNEPEPESKPRRRAFGSRAWFGDR